MATLEENEIQLNEECHELAKKLQTLTTKIRSTASQQLKPSSPDDLRRYNLKVLNHEEKVLKKQKPMTIPNSCLAVSDDMITELDSTIEQSKTIIEMLHESVTDMEKSAEEKVLIIREQQQISATLQKLTEEQVNTHQTPQSLTTFARNYVKKLKGKGASLARDRENFQITMLGFLGKHFPAKDEFCSLHEIIGKLMKLNVETPESPYLEIKEDIWPPYIELLLRYNICCRHPSNPSMIKLLYDGF